MPRKDGQLYLQPSIKTPGNGDAVGLLPGAAEGLFQLLQGSFRLLQLLDESVNRLLCPLLFFVALVLVRIIGILQIVNLAAL